MWGVCVCVCVYTFIYIHNVLLNIRKNEIMPFATTQMDLEMIILRAVSQTEKDRYLMIAHIQNIKNIQMNLFTKQK